VDLQQHSRESNAPHPVRFGLKLGGQDTTIDELRAVWRIADTARFDHVWVFDHFASIGQGGPNRPVFEAWALQAAMAEATRHVRVGCMVTGNTYRHPVVLAKTAVTVDHLSGGRLEFGIGAAWADAEHRMYGIEGLEHRVGRLSESLQIIRSLWTQERTNFAGRYYQLSQAIANPKPIQQPHPPIWIGASGDLTLRLVARHADVWNAAGGAGGERFSRLTAQLDAHCAAIGRDPRAIRRSIQYSWNGQSRPELLEMAATSLEQGCTEHIILLPAGRAERTAASAAEALTDLRKIGAPALSNP
jgi:F420-dependent oxidoreductase-like protein